MSCPDSITSLLTFYANGSLLEEDRRRVESHLDACIDCRSLLGLARLAREEMAGGAFDPSDHVQAQLLSEYIEDSSAIDDVTARWVATHLERCDDCASVVPVLNDLSETTGIRSPERLGGRPARAVARKRSWRRPWDALLGPIPAAAYLVILIAGLAWIASSGGPGRPIDDTARILPSPVPVHGDVVLRGGEDTAPPLRVETTAGTPVRLALHTDLDPEETAPGAPLLRLVLSRDGVRLWSASVDPSEIPPDGRLEIVLTPDRLPLNVPLDLALERDAGEEHSPLFRKRLLLVMPTP